MIEIKKTKKTFQSKIDERIKFNIDIKKIKVNDITQYSEQNKPMANK